MIKLLIILFIVGLSLVNQAYSYSYDNKNYDNKNVGSYDNKNTTMQVYKNELVYCYFGSPKSSTPVCNYIELDNKMRLIDSFLQFLINGQCQ